MAVRDEKARGERLVSIASETLGADLAGKWFHLSHKTQTAALGVDPTRVNVDLEEAAAEEPESPVAGLFRLWAADTLARTGRHMEAAAGYDTLVGESEGVASFNDIDVIGEALRHRAAALALSGDIDGAIATYRDAAQRDDSTLLYKAGVLAERSGRHDLAIDLYDQVAAPQLGPDPEDRGQRALRSRNRLQDETGVFRPALAPVIDLVERAVDNRDTKTLSELASATNLWVGPGGGHFQFEGPEVVDWLCEDLTRSRPRRVGGVTGTGRKRYVFTTGWRGKRFEGRVGFAFVESGRGWEWTGIVAGANDFWRERWTPVGKMTNQPLPFPLLAPWPAGERFMAGGLPQFAIKSAAVAAALFIPIFGAAAAAGLALGFSLEGCGYGTRGFYYNEGPTHTGQSAFAIDFTTYRRGIPFDNESGGTPVLCAADGVVRMVDEDVASGDDSDANEVQVDHVDPATGTNRFVSRYMHMTGPLAIPVSAGEAAPAGVRLGLMNDTGTSVLDHLHFSVHDTTTGPGIGNSVRPSPLSGVTLGDGDSGTCMRSTNTETIVLPPGCGELVVRLIRQIFGGD